jgi:hypothetical protein
VHDPSGLSVRNDELVSDQRQSAFEARRAQSQMVNFGVAAVARVTDESADRQLALRCECGAVGCTEHVQLSRSEYERLAEAGLPVLCSQHARSIAGGSR